MRRVTRLSPSDRTTKKSLVVAVASSSLSANTFRRCIDMFSGVVLKLTCEPISRNGLRDRP